MSADTMTKDQTISLQARQIELLRELLEQIWRHRNGGTALPSSWDRQVTEVIETNGPS